MNSIKERREKRGLTQEEVAQKLGVTRTAVAKWESGQAMPRARLLKKLSGILRCKIDAIFLP